ncbi:hypothetical protein BGZ72_010050 [Mortierella alpina]|nr:hypothetical protein BGZ72_010014 [Mortierella alpina]KAF9962160.1 hypothetical protein BGZ72_010050 [Mortierella alpina]
MSSANKSSLEESFASITDQDSGASSDTAVEVSTKEEEEGEEKSCEGHMDPTRPRRIELTARRPNLIPSLQAHLKEATYPEEIEGAGWAYGTENNTLKMLVHEWLHNYDWEKELHHMNRDYEHWRCRVNGIDLHYVRHDPWAEPVKDPVTGEVKGGPFAGKTMVNEKGQIIMPLLLLHGWPGSWYEFGKVIPLLKKRGRFQIIVPSLPGFGWSQAPSEKKFGVRAMAKTFHELMLHLGYDHYVVQGGDWGSMIARAIAVLYPEHCLAVHINLLPCLPPRPWRRPFQFAKAVAGFVFPSVVYRNSPHDRDTMALFRKYMMEGNGYFIMQSTKPQTLGHALHGNPVGLLSWMGEKYMDYSDLDPSKPETWPYTITELLTQIMIYHSTDSITSSMRIYYEALITHDGFWVLTRPLPKSVLVGVGSWKVDVVFPRAMAEDWMNIVSWHEFPNGGHFAAFERPVDFEREISGFFTSDLILDQFTAKRHGFKI